jgi:hypothetical protein
MIEIKILLKIILSLLLLLNFLYCYGILITGWDYSTHTAVLEFVEYNPIEELIKFIIAMGLYPYSFVFIISD